MPARLKARGLRTATFISRTHLDPDELNIAGFDRVSVPERSERRASETATEATEWMVRHA